MDLDRNRSIALSRRPAHKKLVARLRRMKDGPLNDLFHTAHDEVFEQVDCTTCANCCKTVGPLFTDRDIERIARHLGMRPGDFVETYLRMDEDDDYVLQQVPCTFLGDDDRCTIYDVRPKACRDYPHTDHPKIRTMLSSALRNAPSCPAVLQVLERVDERVKRDARAG